MKNAKISRISVLNGALLAGLAASACCVLPLLLLWLGVSGAWIANLTALSKFHTEMVAVAVLLLAASYYLIFVREVAECDAEKNCSRPVASATMRFSFWIAAAIILVAFSFPLLVASFY